MVKAAKKATYAVVRDRVLTDEELITVFARMESPVNSRPLTYQIPNASKYLGRLPLSVYRS